MRCAGTLFGALWLSSVLMPGRLVGLQRRALIGHRGPRPRAAGLRLSRGLPVRPALLAAILALGACAVGGEDLPALEESPLEGIAAGSVVGMNRTCLDMGGGASDNGTPIITWPCHGGAPQIWRLHLDAAGGSTGRPRDEKLLEGQAGRVLDVAGGAGNGTPLQLWDYVGGLNQMFNVLGASLIAPGGMTVT